MRSLLIIISFLFITTATLCQPLNDLCDGNKYGVVFYYAGDTVIVPCDTMIMINASTYKLYDLIFKSRKNANQNERLKDRLHEESKRLYEMRIREQQDYILKLENRTDSLVHASLAVVKRTVSGLENVGLSIDKVNNEVHHANTNIAEAITIIEAEKKNTARQKLRWAAGGVTVGVAVTALLFGLSK